MGERDLTRSGSAAPAADERGGGGGVMGGAKGAGRTQRADRPLFGNGMDAGDVESLFAFEGGEDRGEAPRQHRLARTRGPNVEQVMPAGGADLEREAGSSQAAYVTEVERLVTVERVLGRRLGRRWRFGPGRFALETFLELDEVAGAKHDDPLHQRGLGRVGDGHDDLGRPGASQTVDEGEHTGQRPHRSVEAQLAQHCEPFGGRAGEVAFGGEDPDRDRELEARAGLAEPTGGEVHGDAFHRPGEVRRQERGPHPFA